MLSMYTLYLSGHLSPYEAITYGNVPTQTAVNLHDNVQIADENIVQLT